MLTPRYGQREVSYRLKPPGVAVMRCHDCGAVGEQTIANGHSPEHVIKRFRTVGWQADLHTKRLCRCPKCVQSEIRGGRTMKGQWKESTAMPPETTLQAQALPLVVPPAPPTATALTAPLPIKPPLTAQVNARLQVRQLLDANFDDARGRYINGYSDERVAGDAGCPVVVVKQIRDLAYGPLVGDPEVNAIRDELATMRARLPELEAKLTAAEARLLGGAR